jgi:hypothetical protein
VPSLSSHEVLEKASDPFNMGGLEVLSGVRGHSETARIYRGLRRAGTFEALKRKPLAASELLTERSATFVPIVLALGLT